MFDLNKPLTEADVALIREHFSKAVQQWGYSDINAYLADQEQRWVTKTITIPVGAFESAIAAAVLETLKLWAPDAIQCADDMSLALDEAEDAAYTYLMDEGYLTDEDVTYPCLPEGAQ